MSKYNKSEIQFKIIPENSYFIIGSNSKNQPGELFTVDIQFNIQNPILKRRKRLFDVFISLLSVLFFPIFLLNNTLRKILKNCIAIFIGKKTLVGYSHPESKELPKLKPAIFDVSHSVKNKEFIHFASVNYARDYSVYKDFEVLWRCVFKNNL